MPEDVCPPYIQEFGPYRLNTMNFIVSKSGHGPVATLTRFEATILQCLIAKPGELVYRDEIYKILYGDRPVIPSSNGLETFVRRIRRKLDPANTERPIETVRGRGYMLRRWENRAAA